MRCLFLHRVFLIHFLTSNSIFQDLGIFFKTFLNFIVYNLITCFNLFGDLKQKYSNIPQSLTKKHENTNVTGRHKIHWELNGKASGERRNVPPFYYCSINLAGTSHFISPVLKLGFMSTSSLDSQALESRLNYTIGFLDLQLADERLWDFSASITASANFS